MKRNKPIHGSGSRALTPDYTTAERPKSDPIHTALSVALLDSKREIAGRDKRLAAQEATIRELRTRVRFLENTAKMTAGPR